jgi:O-antigen ligase
MLQPLRHPLRLLLALEPLVWAGVFYLFWFPDPDRTFALLLVAAIGVVRVLAFGLRRPGLAWPVGVWAFIGVCGALVALGLLSPFVAPYTWGITPITLGGFSISVEYAWVMVARVGLGVLLALRLIDALALTQPDPAAATDPAARAVVRLFAGLAALTCLIAVFSLFATAWDGKSGDFRPLLDLIPRITTVEAIRGGFNPNEIGGALAWVIPAWAAFAAAWWRWGRRDAVGMAVRTGALVVFAMLMLGLFLGQSRLAIIGVIGGLAIVIALLVPRGRPQQIASVMLVAFVLLEIAVVTRVFSPNQAALIERDEDSLSSRLLIWESALRIVGDYPATGSGANTFRHPDVRRDYPVLGYETRVLPHAHNLWLQTGADLGVPGVLALAAVYATAAWAAVRVFRRRARVHPWVWALAVAAGAGLLSHLAFAMGDAIALWDRLGFVGWWLLGLLMAAGAAAERGYASARHV